MGVFANLWGGIPDAPSDGKPYARQDKRWVLLDFLTRWINNTDTANVAGIVYIWMDSESWDDGNPWKG